MLGRSPPDPEQASQIPTVSNPDQEYDAYIESELLAEQVNMMTACQDTFDPTTPPPDFASWAQMQSLANISWTNFGGGKRLWQIW